MRDLCIVVIFILFTLVLNVGFLFGRVHQYVTKDDDYDPLDDGVVVLDKKTNSFELTKLQEKQIEFFLLERDSKIAAMEKELAIRKKLFQEELCKPNNDISSIELEKLMQDIQEITFTIERIKIDSQINIRNVLSSRQYYVFVQEQKEQEQKKNKKKKN